jgi:hypothetical protein
MMRHWLRVFVVGAAVVLSPGAIAETSGLELFLKRSRCDVAMSLATVYDAKADADRYIVVSLDWPRRGYVQCLFEGEETNLLCEAESGFYEVGPGVPQLFRVQPAGREALRELGFLVDVPERNYQMLVWYERVPDFNAVAELMLTALYRGYEGVPDAAVEIEAPFAQERHRPEACSIS